MNTQYLVTCISCSVKVYSANPFDTNAFEVCSIIPFDTDEAANAFIQEDAKRIHAANASRQGCRPLQIGVGIASLITGDMTWKWSITKVVPKERFYYMSRYSWDPGESICGPFDSHEEAQRAMEANADSEYQRDLVNSPFPCDLEMDKDAGEITLTNHRDWGDDVTTWFVFSMSSATEPPYPPRQDTQQSREG